MMSSQKHQPTWAEIVKGKAAAMASVEPKFQFDPEVPEFKLNVGQTLNPSAKEFDPAGQCFNPSAKEFDPSESKVMQRAAEMTSLLLECYSDSDSEDDEVPCPQPRRVAAPVVTSKTSALLNPFAKVFSPPAVPICEKAKNGFCMNSINLSYSSSDSEDESPQTSPRIATAPKRLRDCKDMSSPPVVAFRPPPGLTLPSPVALNMDCYSSDDESPRPVHRGNARKCLAKITGDVAEDSDSTSAGQTSDSDIESL